MLLVLTFSPVMIRISYNYTYYRVLYGEDCSEDSKRRKAYGDSNPGAKCEQIANQVARVSGQDIKTIRLIHAGRDIMEEAVKTKTIEEVGIQ